MREAVCVRNQRDPRDDDRRDSQVDVGAPASRRLVIGAGGRATSGPRAEAMPPTQRETEKVSRAQSGKSGVRAPPWGGRLRNAACESAIRKTAKRFAIVAFPGLLAMAAAGSKHTRNRIWTICAWKQPAKADVINGMLGKHSTISAHNRYVLFLLMSELTTRRGRRVTSAS